MNLMIMPKSDELLDIAFRRARKEAAMLKSERNTIKDAKGKNIKRIETSAHYIVGVIERVTEEFPDMKKANPFYRELIKTTIDLEATLKALGHFTAERKIILMLKRASIGRIKELDKQEAAKASKISTEFYGRLSHLVKKLGKSIKIYNKSAIKLKELPKIKQLPTAIIAGFPNTGKSTVLGRLTTSQPKIASYPFTTKKLQIGYLIHNYQKLQLVDTPGLLDRPLGERNTIERKAIAALRHLSKLLVFVVDPTMQCSFTIEQQQGLLKEIQKELGELEIVIVYNKADIASKEEMEKAKKLFGQGFVEGEGIESKLKERIIQGLEKELKTTKTFN